MLPLDSDREIGRAAAGRAIAGWSRAGRGRSTRVRTRYTAAMRCFLRYLRIALSVVCGLVCVLLVALWVRSFVVCDSLSINSGHRIASLGGALFFDGNFVISGGKLTATQRRLFGYEIQCVSLDWKKVRQGAGSGPCVP